MHSKQNNINSTSNPAGNYMFKVKNRNTRIRCEICSKLTIKTPERRQWCRFGVFTVNFEHISHLILVFLLLTLSIGKCRLRVCSGIFQLSFINSASISDKDKLF